MIVLVILMVAFILWWGAYSLYVSISDNMEYKPRPRETTEINISRRSQTSTVTSSRPPEKQIMTSKMLCQLLQKTDPGFDENNFITYAQSVFLKLMAAWSNRDLSPMRPYETTDLLFEQQDDLRHFYLDQSVNCIKQTQVTHVSLRAYQKNEQAEYLTVLLRANQIDYIKDIVSGRILTGSATQAVSTENTLTFTRPVYRESTAPISTENCPNCGAPISEDKIGGTCAYCGSAYRRTPTKWLLCRFDCTRQTG